MSMWPLPPPDARSEDGEDVAAVDEEPRVPASPRVKVLSKRRQRRREQQLQLERILEELESDEEDEQTPSRDYAKRLIDDSEALGRFLNGARPSQLPRRSRASKRLCERDREAKRGWLRIERCLRCWLRRYAQRDLEAVAAAEALLSDLLGAAEDPPAAEAAFLRLPIAVVETRLVMSIAQFHGCSARVDDADFLVLQRRAPLSHGATVSDALRLLAVGF